MEGKLITIYTGSYARGQIIKAHLESAKIKCFLTDLDIPQPSSLAGVKIQVHENNVKRAILITKWVKGVYLKDGQKRKPRHNYVRRLFVPVDFTESAYNAAYYALRLASIYKAQVFFMHVYHWPAIDVVSVPDVSISQYTYEAMGTEMKKKARKKMSGFMSDIRNHMSKHKLDIPSLKTVVVEGIVNDTILEYAKKHKANYIIMGGNPAEKNGKSYLGSVVWNVIQKAKCPVLYLPQEHAWKDKKGSYNVLFAADLDKGIYVALRKLLSILKPIEKVKLHCVHLTKDKPNFYQNERIKEIEKYIANVSNCQFSANIIQTSNYMESFNAFVTQEKIDLVCMSTRKRNIIERFFSPSLTKKMLYQSYAPLLVVHI